MLCMTLLSPSIFAAMLPTRIEPYVVSIKTMKSSKAMTVLDTSLVFNEHITTMEYNNGSTNITISEHFFIGEGECPRDLWVNMTQMLPPKEEMIQEAHKTINLIQPCGGTFPGKYQWDGMTFLPQGNNGTHLVEYTYDDNLDTYFPCEWFTHWNLSGINRSHVHLGAQEVTDWLNGVKDTAELCSVIFAGLGGGLTLIGGIAAFFDCPLVAVPAIIAGVCSIIEAIIQWYYAILKAQWIRDAVQTWYGDGFTWLGWVLSGLKMDWYCPYETKAITVYEYWAERYWEQAWGSELNQMSNQWQWYTISWFDHQNVKGGGTSVIR